jgi:hypothetical protein
MTDTPDFEGSRREILSFLLSSFPARSGPTTVQALVYERLGRRCNTEYIAAFWEGVGEKLRGEIIDEYNKRLDEGSATRFVLLDDIGEKIAGTGYRRPAPLPVSFQDALHELDHTEFEALSAAILRVAGCQRFWTTPHSHDQGLDAFGYLDYLGTLSRTAWSGSCPQVVFLAQAKHFLRDRVDAEDIHQLVGAAELAKQDIYTVRNRYKELLFHAFSPVALLYVTSGEIKTTAKRLAIKAGIVLLASNELFRVFDAYWKSSGLKVQQSKRGFLRQLRREIGGIQQAV